MFKTLIRSLALTLALTLALSPGIAEAQQFNTIPDHSVIGRVGTGTSSGPSQAIPFATLTQQLLAGQALSTFANIAAAKAAQINTNVQTVYTLGFSTAGDNGGASYVRISASTAAAWRFQSADGQWWALNNRDVTPEMFGAVGNGTTDNTAVFSSIATWLNSFAPSGVSISNLAGANYAIWPQASGSPGNLMVLSGINGLTWRLNGSQISTNNTNLANSPRFIDCSHCSNILMFSPNWNETAWSALSDTSDAVFFHISETSAPWSNNIHFFNWTQNGGSAGLEVTASQILGGGQASNFSIINAKFTNVFYPMNFQGSGDGFFASGISCSNVGRCYFPWNVSHHNVDIVSSNGGGAFNDVLLKVYAIPAASAERNSLSDIHVVYRNIGRINNSNSSSLVNLSFQQVVAQPNVSGAANNGSGLVRLTVDTTANMATGQTWFVNSVGGVTGATNGSNWVVTVIDGTHVDLQGSSFAGSYTSGGYLRVPAMIKNVDVTFDVDDAGNGQPNALTTYKFNSDASADTTTDNYRIENIGIHGTIKNYNYGLAAIDLFNNDATNPGGGVTVGAIGTWSGETLRNIRLRDLVINGTNSSVLVNATNISTNLQLENIYSTPTTVPWTLTGAGTNTRIKDVSATGITDRQTYAPISCSTSQFANSFSNLGVISCAQVGFSNLSGSLACSQAPALTGDTATTAGSCGTSTTSSGGVPLNYGAISTATPTLSASTGTFTAAAAALSYQTRGKQTWFNVVVNITTNGTAAGNVSVNGLPFTFGSDCTASGRATLISGKMLQSLGSSGGNSLVIWNQDNTYPGATGERLVINGVCQNT